MKRYTEKFIYDVKENNITKKDREVLLDTLEYLMLNTSGLVKKAEFDIADFADAGKKVKGYTLILDRLLRASNMEQWQLTCIKDDEVKMVAQGQINW